MVLAQGLTVESATAKHTLGQRYIDMSNGDEYLYCQDSGSGSAQYAAVSITPAFATASLTKANADKNYLVGVPQIAVTASYYYWCKRKGAATDTSVLTASAAASEALLYTTATPGRLDDDSSSQTAIAGIQLTATAATAAASAITACILDNPKPFAAEVSLDTAQSAATSAGGAASTADSKALSTSSSAATAASAADSKAVSAATEGGASAAGSAVTSHKTSSAH